MRVARSDLPPQGREKIRVGGQFLQPLRGHRLENQPWIFGRVPQFRIHRAPQVVGAVMPAPAQVQRQLGQRLQRFR